MDDVKFNRATAAPIARALIRTARDAALATLDPDGSPHASHVAAATFVDGAPMILVSDLALHTQNLKRDRRTSLLYVAAQGTGRDTNTRARITLVGEVEPAPDRDAARARFLRRHPDASLYIDFADFSLWRLVPRASHLVAGFGRIVGLAPEVLMAQGDLVAGLADVDASACEHMNADHLDALGLMAERIAGAPAGDWRAIGIDPQGIDLSDGSSVTRVEFDEPVGGSSALRVALKRLADRARDAHSAKT